MSPPDRQLVLSPQAEDDLADILQHTLETWGESQLLAYGKVLDDGLRMILHNPLIGFARPAVSDKHRFFSTGEHLIAYRLTPTRIEISRILHCRMDLKRNL
jgi:toxin ParE1/3/4